MKDIIKQKRALYIIDKFKGARVLIVGDLIMDHFIWGDVSRISPEAPVPVVDVKSESILLGGSANVVNNIHNLGGNCVVTGIVGDDSDGKSLRKSLSGKKISTRGIIVDPERPTTIKTRIIAHSQQVVRFDREKREKIDGTTLEKVLRFIKRAVKTVDLVIISDYAKGLISPGLVEEITTLAAKSNIPVVVDPKVEHFGYYKDVTVITPNNLEASRSSGVEISDDHSLHLAGETLLKRTGAEALLITRGEHGMSLFEKDGDRTHIPTVAQEVYDVSGAGDTVIGVLGLALASGASFREAAVLANFAAGIVVGKVGTATVTMEELKAAVSSGLKKKRD